MSALFVLPNTIRYLDVTNGSISAASATPLELKGAKNLVLTGSPTTTVYVAPIDLAPNQMIVISNASTQNVNVSSGYALGTTTIWTQNGSGSANLGGTGAWGEFYFLVDSSNNGTLSFW